MSSMDIDSPVSPNMAITPVTPTDYSEPPPSQEQPNKRGRKKSIVWEHFTIETVAAGCMRAVCKQCKKSFPYITGSKLAGTSHLKRHIALGMCPANRQDNEVSPYTPSVKSDPLPPAKRPRSTPRYVNMPFDQNRCTLELAKMIIQHEYPLHIVEHPAFIDFVKTLQPQYSMVDFNTIEGECVGIYLREKQWLLNLINEVPARVNLTMDLATSNQDIGYALITGHFIDNNWNLQRQLLNVIVVPFPDSDYGFNQAIATCLTDWHLESKLFSLTLDRSFANDTMTGNLRGMVSVRNPLVLNGQLIKGSCFARVLSRLAQDAIGSMGDVVRRIRESVKHVKTSEAYDEKFAELRQQLQVPSTKELVMDDPTKWNTTYHMLVSACELKEVFSCMDLSDPVYNININLSIDDWKQLEVLCTYLKLFYDAANFLTSPSHPLANSFYHEVSKIQLELTHAAMSQDPIVGHLTRPLKEKFDQYWKECFLVLALAIVMDPRFKMKLIEFSFSRIFGEDAGMWIKTVDDGIHELFHEYVSPNFYVPAPTSVEGDMGIPHFEARQDVAMAPPSEVPTQHVATGVIQPEEVPMQQMVQTDVITFQERQPEEVTQPEINHQDVPSARIHDQEVSTHEVMSQEMHAQELVLQEMHKQEFSSQEVQVEAVPPYDIQSEAVQARDNHAEEVPPQDNQAEAVHLQDVQAVAVPSQEVQSEAMPPLEVQSEAMLQQEMQSEAVTSQEVQTESSVILPQEVQAKAEAATSEEMQAKSTAVTSQEVRVEAEAVPSQEVLKAEAVPSQEVLKAEAVPSQEVLLECEGVQAEVEEMTSEAVPSQEVLLECEGVQAEVEEMTSKEIQAEDEPMVPQEAEDEPMVPQEAKAEAVLVPPQEVQDGSEEVLSKELQAKTEGMPSEEIQAKAEAVLPQEVQTEAVLSEVQGDALPLQDMQAQAETLPPEEMQAEAVPPHEMQSEAVPPPEMQDEIGTEQVPPQMMQTEEETAKEVSTQEPLPQEINTREMPQQEMQVEVVPPPQEMEAEVVPPSEVQDKIQTEVVPPQMMQTEEETTKEVNSQEVLPQEMNTHEMPVQEIDTQELPPGKEDTQVLPPPEEDTQQVPPPEEDTQVLPPPEEDTQHVPPPGEDAQVLPPPEEDTQQVPTAGEDTRVLPLPEENTQQVPPPVEDNQEMQPLQPMQIEEVPEQETDAQSVKQQDAHAKEVQQQEIGMQKPAPQVNNFQVEPSLEMHNQEASSEDMHTKELPPQEMQTQEVLPQETQNQYSTSNGIYIQETQHEGMHDANVLQHMEIEGLPQMMVKQEKNTEELQRQELPPQEAQPQELQPKMLPQETHSRGMHPQDLPLLSIGDGLSDFDVYLSEITSGNKKSELDQYLEESLLPRVQEFDVLEWWKLNKLKYPNLSKLAADILSIPISTVSPDSVFDTRNKTVDNYRSSLRPVALEALICAKQWLQQGSLPAELSNTVAKMEY